MDQRTDQRDIKVIKQQKWKLTGYTAIWQMGQKVNKMMPKK